MNVTKERKSMNGTKYTSEACSNALMYERNDEKWSKIVTHLIAYKGNEKKTSQQYTRKKERNRTANSKNESNVRPTQLVRLQSKEKIYLFYVFNILLPGIIKQESKEKRVYMFYLKPIIGE